MEPCGFFNCIAGMHATSCAAYPGTFKQLTFEHLKSKDEKMEELLNELELEGDEF